MFVKFFRILWTLFLYFMAVIGVMIAVLVGAGLWFGPEFGQMSNATKAILSQVKVGSAVTDIEPPEAHRLFMTFRSEQRNCLRYSQYGSERYVEIGNSGERKALGESSFKELVLAQQEEVLECNEVFFTIFGQKTKARRSLTITYDGKGRVTEVGKPYTWD